jgi:hypothetical protein
MKLFLPLVVLVLLALGCSSGRTTTTIVDYTVNASVPDNSPIGIVDTRTISGSTILGITHIDLRLQLSGG